MDALTGSSPSRRRELEARIVLEGLPGVGPATARKLIAAAGSARSALMRSDLLQALAGAGARVASLDPAARDRAARALDDAAAAGVEVLMMEDPAYPPRLRHLADPPSLLFLRGRKDLLERPGVGIVGARRSTQRARNAARRLGAAVAQVGVPVVSGMALGVDGAAHQGALDVSGPTVAVLGTGVDDAYPPGHRRLFARIVADGLVVSEFPPGTPALPHHFPRRNRILAALSGHVVVVEAGSRSGALITAEHALDLGLEVWAVPGPFGEDFCAGSNALLGDGARPLVTVNGFVRMALGVEPGRPEMPTSLSEEEVRLLETLATGTLRPDELARRLDVDAGRIVSLLSSMELRGHVTREPGMRFRRAG